MLTTRMSIENLLWCEECNKGHPGECPIHGPLTRIKDKLIPSQARLTLPHLLSLKELEIRAGNDKLFGVFAKKIIQNRTQFGPLRAPRYAVTTNEPITNSSGAIIQSRMFKIFHSGICVYQIDTSNESACNWLMFVRLAQSTQGQNVVAYQHKDDIYFTTIKPIEPHVELKVWYAASYGRLMGFQPLPKADEADSNAGLGSSTSHPLKIPQISPGHVKTELGDLSHDSSWKCSHCGQIFGSFHLLDDHQCEKQSDPSTPHHHVGGGAGGKRSKKRKQQNLVLRISKRKLRSRRDGGACGSPLGEADDSSAGGGEDVAAAASSASTAGSMTVTPLIIPKVKGRKGRVLKTVLTCETCGKVFINADKLQTHRYTHTGERPHRCSYDSCAKAFVSRYKLIRHTVTHSPDKTQRCVYCDKRFHRKDHLKNHLLTHDPNKASFKCDRCAKAYNTRMGFRKHAAIHAAEDGELACKMCNKIYATKPELLDHIRAHAGGRPNGPREKKHQCNYCDRLFYTRKDVRRHMVVHTGRKDFLCQFCAQRFGRKDHLTRHTKKSHLGMLAIAAGRSCGGASPPTLLAQISGAHPWGVGGVIDSGNNSAAAAAAHHHHMQQQQQQQQSSSYSMPAPMPLPKMLAPQPMNDPMTLYHHSHHQPTSHHHLSQQQQEAMSNQHEFDGHAPMMSRQSLISKSLGHYDDLCGSNGGGDGGSGGGARVITKAAAKHYTPFHTSPNNMSPPHHPKYSPGMLPEGHPSAGLQLPLSSKLMVSSPSEPQSCAVATGAGGGGPGQNQAGLSDSLCQLLGMGIFHFPNAHHNPTNTQPPPPNTISTLSPLSPGVSPSPLMSPAVSVSPTAPLLSQYHVASRTMSPISPQVSPVSPQPSPSFLSQIDLQNEMNSQQQRLIGHHAAALGIYTTSPGNPGNPQPLPRFHQAFP